MTSSLKTSEKKRKVCTWSLVADFCLNGRDRALKMRAYGDFIQLQLEWRHWSNLIRSSEIAIKQYVLENLSNAP